MNNKKGVSLISLTITIIVLIILAGITIGSGFSNIEKTQKAAFLSDFGNALENLRTYNQRAEAFSTLIGKLEIRSGDLYIKEGYTTELEWAKEIHDYMNVLDN